MARLLVVDDEQDICDLVVKRLVGTGHEVLAADGPLTALALVDRHGPPDAAVLDVDMLGMDGFALLERLRERRPGLRALFLTVLWGPEVHDRIRASGAGYVAKPFTAAELRDGVERMLAGEVEPGYVPGQEP